ncbi:hypothetical protein [Salinisphaera sp. G21_0]|uniref:hypothetical protein n=1 Tax=Salinisphaera sp. G21_0 TaxID=2821094 RepID=UPI001ADA3254|nr:hypothetical protein [Salinisphaera sp. G21_0]MBO9479973.1 hypothetical protein [Salinisphaera sp. G21_0]
MSKSQPVPPPATTYADTASITGTLNDILRGQLAGVSQNTQPAAVEPTEKTESLLTCAVATVREILQQPLDKTSLDFKLEKLFEHQHNIYNGCDISSALRKRQYIGRHGLVMSPDYGITTQKDSLRVRAFIRAINHAVAKLVKHTPGPLHIVYPACGPLAPLLLPLIAYYQQLGLYSGQDLQITLIDMQPGAVASLHAQVDALQITPFIRDIQLLDGCMYETSEPVHIVVLEAMQHGFSREGHLALARHFASRIEPGGFFIPREVSLRAVINEGQQEYNDQWQDKSGQVFAANMSQETLERRIDLGEILSLTLESLRNLPEQVIDEFTSLIQCGTVTLPELPEHMKHPIMMICTRVITGDNGEDQEIIGEYDSGITHPLPDMQACINFVPTEPKPGDLLVNSGDQLTFYYRLNGLPGFLPVKA